MDMQSLFNTYCLKKFFNIQYIIYGRKPNLRPQVTTTSFHNIDFRWSLVTKSWRRVT